MTAVEDGYIQREVVRYLRLSSAMVSKDVSGNKMGVGSELGD